MNNLIIHVRLHHYDPRPGRHADGGHVVVGFDFPIGVPAAYAGRAGVERFRDFLAQLGRDGWGRFYDVAEKPHDIGVRRPFYPMRNGRPSITQRSR